MKLVIRCSSATRSETSSALSRATRSVPNSSTLYDASAVPYAIARLSSTGCPERPVAGPRHSVRIAHARREHPRLAGRRIDLENRSATLLFVQTVFGGVAVRTDAHIQFGAVGARDEALGPVMVDRAAGQVHDFLRPQKRDEFA